MAGPPQVWIVTTGEPLPTDPGRPRLLRSGILAQHLVEAGCDVTFWSALFDHARKGHRHPGHQAVTVPLGRRHRLRLLPSPGYARNVSLARIHDHWVLGRRFLAEASRLAPPDAMVVAMPPIDLACAGARYARARQVPWILDIRDLWPDIFFAGRAEPGRTLIRAAALPLELRLRRALREASAVAGITDEIVAWGLAKVGRRRNPGLDLALPLACGPRDPDPPDRAAGLARWRSRGVAEGPVLRVAFLGSMTPRVDLLTVARAARILHARGRPVQFVLCGDGELGPELRKACAGLPNVILPGWVDMADIPTLLGMSTLGIIPYRNSIDFVLSIPNKVIEYLSGGVPLLTSLEGTTGRLVREHALGFTYAEGDPRSLAEVLEGLLDRPDSLAGIPANARRLFEARFSAEVVYGRYVDLITRIIGMRRSGSGYPWPVS